MAVKLRVLSLFTGAGGLDLGLEAAGFSIMSAIDVDSSCCLTLKANRDWRIINQDIHEVSSQELADACSVSRGSLDLLSAGPPCQPFSKSAYWALRDTRRLNDPRASTLTAFVRVLRDLEPRAFILEAVHGLVYRHKDEGLQLLERAVEQIYRRRGVRYSFCWALLNCADYGVPQTRQRVFIVGARDGTRFRFPAATHCEPSGPNLTMFDSGLNSWNTAWDAIGDLNDLPRAGLEIGGRWGRLVPSIPEGSNYLYHTDRGEGLPIFGWRRRYWTFLLKLSKDRPSWTIQAQPGSAIGPFHWKNRRLSETELCRLQTFPNGFRIQGSGVAAQRQIGNAVPPLMAEVLGQEIKRQLFGINHPGHASVLMPKQRRPIPVPEAVQKVPMEYHRLIGKYAPHPGTGLGHKVKGS